MASNEPAAGCVLTLKERTARMLVLSRKERQVITIGDDIRISIVRIRGDTTRIGVEAPRGVAGHREEVYEAIKREQTATNGRESGATECA